jgi:hypothetical protein
MNKTIYVRDEDLPLWDRARELAGDKLSPVIIDGLKAFIAGKEAQAALTKGFERIEVSFSDADAHGILRRIAFQGKWIFPPEKPLSIEREDEHSVERFAVASTAKGAFLFYWWTDYPDSQSFKTYKIFKSLEEAAADRYLNWAARQAIEAQGVPVLELDI